MEGPSESKMSCKDNKDGSCSVEYVPFSAGLYDINITYGGEHIPGERACSAFGGGGGLLPFGLFKYKPRVPPCYPGGLCTFYGIFLRLYFFCSN